MQRFRPGCDWLGRDRVGYIRPHRDRLTGSGPTALGRVKLGWPGIPLHA
jgi:hypothetical protein